MGKIFCLLGKSGSGKDTIFNRLMVDQELKLRPVISYTTRPKRCNEIDGVEYFFISEAELAGYNLAGKVIEQREYQTIQGRWCYSTVDTGQFDLARESYLAILTPVAYMSFQTYFGRDLLYPIYIAVDDGTRLERALARERAQQQPNYAEICRRFLADNMDFAAHKLMEIGVEKHYHNNNLEKCVKQIKEDIQQKLNRC